MKYLLIVADVDECQMFRPCHNNGSCLNNNGSYECDCLKGWEGQHCDKGRYIYTEKSFFLIVLKVKLQYKLSGYLLYDMFF